MGIKSKIRLIASILLLFNFIQNSNAMEIIQKSLNLDFKGKRIVVNKFQTAQDGKCAVILHGMAIYGDYYFDAINYLPSEYTNFYFIDMLHHGHSDGEKGFLPNKDTIVEILDFTLDYILVSENIPKIDLILGESMGGIFALYYLLNEHKFTPTNLVIFSTPLKINYNNFIDINNINLVSNFLFSRNKLVVPIKELNKQLVEDQILLKKIELDTLVPDRVNINYLLTLKEMINHINRNFSKITIKSLFIYGEFDAVSNTSKIVKRNKKYKNIKTIVFKDQPHAIFWNKQNDYLGYITKWLNE
jgi:pimeloyl-ACP methyl ester carboxylesterase